MTLLVVGAGFAGAVHARVLADAGHRVHVIDRRSHVAGTCHDRVHESGVRLHRYGPHIFHTSNLKVVEWLSRFTGWLPYEHRVVARIPDGRTLPVPINLDTVNALFGLELATAAEMAAHLSAVREPRTPVASAEDYLYSSIGPELTNLFVRPYTRKMYGLDLAQVGASVVRRLPIRTDRDGRYFPDDTFQAMPREGYTALFERMLDHPAITLELGRAFDHAMLGRYHHCFNSMPIDEFFGFALGELPYRSSHFHVSAVPAATAPRHVTIDYTDASPFTREVWWHNLPGHHVAKGATVVRTIEEPCDYRDNGLERYYPIKTPDGRTAEIYRQYREQARALGGVTFIGRCGTFQYLDMHQVVNQSLAGAMRWIAARRGTARTGDRIPAAAAPA